MEISIQHSYGVCERGGGEAFWAEPLNAFTNFIFLYVAYKIWSIYSKNEELKGAAILDLHVLTALTFIIGVASFWFHTIPTIYTELMDLIPIVAFILIFFVSAMFRVADCNWFQALISMIAFLGFTHMIVTQFPKALNDSIGYLTTMSALVMIALYLNMKRRPSARAFLVAAITGVLSLFFRAIDNAVCGVIPIGTHFLWHTLNATLIYQLLYQLFRNIRRKQRILAHEEYLRRTRQSAEDATDLHQA